MVGIMGMPKTVADYKNKVSKDAEWYLHMHYHTIATTSKMQKFFLVTILARYEHWDSVLYQKVCNIALWWR